MEMIIGLSIIALTVLWFHRRQRTRPTICGFVQHGFEPVKEAFIQNFDLGWENKGGSSFTVYHKGELVVDLWGGYAKLEIQQEWEEDTIANIFSCGKGVVAIAAAMLVDRGHLSYQAYVAEYWPEFAVNGKDKITVEMLLSHQGGLDRAQFPTTWEDIGDHKKMSKLLSEMTPTWAPGSVQAYHTYTYGWLADQLIRRVDPRGRSVSQFLREELAVPLGVDFWIGLPKSDYHRKAYAYRPTVIEFLYGVMAYPGPLLTFLFKLNKKSLLPSDLTNKIENFTNNPKLLTYEIPAANGVASSRAMARIWGIIANDGVDLITGRRFLSKDAVNQLTEVKTNRHDYNIGMEAAFGPGCRIMSDCFKYQGKYVQVFGHTGFGGQWTGAERDLRVSAAYLTNTLHMFVAKDPRPMRLIQTVFDCLPS